MNIHRQACKKLPFQRGFGLIEVLIALFILSTGMLGLAAVQLNALQAARQSLDTTMATIMARDLVERAWLQYHQGCTADDAAWQDKVTNWQNDIADTLPGGQGEIVENKDKNGVVNYAVVTVTWQAIGWVKNNDNDAQVKLAAKFPCDAKPTDNAS